MDFKKLFKLSKALLKLSDVMTDNGILVFEDTVEVGVEVFTEDENGELVPAADGEYTTAELIYVIKDGKLAEIKEIPMEPVEPVEPAEPVEPITPVEEPMEGDEPAEPTEPATDEKDAKIAELEASIKEKDDKIAELEAKIAELEKANEEFSRKPAFKEVEDKQEPVCLAEAVRKMRKA